MCTPAPCKQQKHDSEPNVQMQMQRGIDYACEKKHGESYSQANQTGEH